MRIAYCTNVRLPTERAHGHQVARVCDALAKLGHDVTIFAPFRRNPVKNTFWDFHNADKSIKMNHLGTFDPIDSWIPKILQLPALNFFFARALKKELTTTAYDVIYTRTPALLPTLLKTNIPVILELHTLPNRDRGRFVECCNRCALIVCLTTPMRDELVSWGTDAKKSIVESDAIDMKFFENVPAGDYPTPDQLPDDAKFVGYAGQIVSMGLSKGITEMLDTLEILTKKEVHVFGKIAGPPPADEQLAKKLGKHPAPYFFYSFIPHDLISGFYASCDVLVYPAPKSSHSFFMRDTSPLKIFEYMAAGKPIVTADLPPIRDILDESTAFFCKPGDPQDLARAIKEALDSPEEAQKRAAAARKKVEQYTWDKRMQRILNVFSSLSPRA